MSRHIVFEDLAAYFEANTVPKYMKVSLTERASSSEKYFLISGGGMDDSLPGGYLLVTAEVDFLGDYALDLYDGCDTISREFDTKSERDACFKAIKKRKQGVTFAELMEQRLFEY